MTDKEEFELNKNQIEMLEFLEDARSSEEHPVDMKSAFGFKIYHNESDLQIKKYVDYLEISSHGHLVHNKVSLGYIKDNVHGAWITKSGKEALARVKKNRSKNKKKK